MTNGTLTEEAVGSTSDRAAKRMLAFWGGTLSSFAIPTMPDLDNGPAEDAQALRGDLCAVGDDMRAAIDRFSKGVDRDEP